MIGKVGVRGVDCIEDVLKVVGGFVDKNDVRVYVDEGAVTVTVTYTTLQTMVCTVRT